MSPKKNRPAATVTKTFPVIDIKGSGKFSVPIVGESQYLSNFESLFGRRTEDGVSYTCDALLVPEPDNSYDSNAVRVIVNDLLLGYLERESAKNIVASMKRNNTWGSVIRVKCRIKGGWYRSPSDQGHFGVQLDFPDTAIKKRS